MPVPPFLAAAGADTVLRVYVTPRAGRSELAGERDGALWVRLAAPPVDGAANRTLIHLLAATLDVPRSRLHLQAGATGRQKVVRLAGFTPEEVAARLGRPR